jgi:hypothetical protein
MVELLLQDFATLEPKDEWAYVPRLKEKDISTLYTFLNNISEVGAGKFLPDEISKSQKDILIVELVIRLVKECMVFFGRNKTIDIPLRFIHLIPEGSNYKASLFGGIVVERVADDRVFAIKLFQKVFAKTSFSAIKINKDRTLTFIDVGGNIKEAVASLISRSFFEDVVLQNNLFLKGEPIVEKECFDLEAEAIFNEAFEEVLERNKGFLSREKLFKDAVEATVNGRIIPLMVLRDRKVEQGEVNNLLRWFNEVGTRLS